MSTALVWVGALALALAACTATDEVGSSDPGGTTGDDLPGESTTSTEAVTTTTVTLPPEDVSERVLVDGVIDGDTFRVTRDGQAVDVRLLGLNAPEIDECHGDVARAALTDLLAGFRVRMVAGDEDADAFDRLLRFVYLEPEGAPPIFVNAELIRIGAALALQDGSGLEGELKRLEDRSFASGLGMWGTFVCGQVSGGTPDRPQLHVADISFDATGDDATALTDEWVEIVNESYTTVALGAWTLRDESSLHRFEFPASAAMAPGETMRIVTGCGTSGTATLFWCSDRPVWSNGGDTVLLLDSLGNVVERWVSTGS